MEKGKDRQTNVSEEGFRVGRLRCEVSYCPDDTVHRRAKFIEKGMCSRISVDVKPLPVVEIPDTQLSV